MKSNHGDPVWLELTTDDVASAREFYGSLFGWTVRETTFGSSDVAAIHLDGQPVAGVASAIDKGTGEQRYDVTWRVYVAVDDISNTTSAVPLSLGHINLPPVRYGMGTVALIEDPDGGVLGLWESDEYPGFAVGPAHGQLCWFDLETNDFESVSLFYRQVLGWQYHFVAEDGRMIPEPNRTDEHRYATNGDTGVATVGIADGFDSLDDTRSSGWQFYVAVTDVDATCARAVTLGGEVLAGPVDNYLGRVAALRDPSGADFRVMESPVSGD